MSSHRRPPGGAALVFLRVVSALELVSLVVIVLNRVTIHHPAITSSGGPVHGVLYVSTIVLALLLPLPRAAKWLAVVPGVGGLLALWHARRVARQDVRELDARPADRRASLSPDDRADAAVVADGVAVRPSKTAMIGPLTFSVPRGKITGLIGPNGGGKTTVLRMLSGLVTPSEGSVHFAEDLADAGSLGVLIDDPGFLPALSARTNLLVLAQLAGWSPDTVEEALSRVALTASADTPVAAFSRGMTQRLGIAAALLGRPPVLILDEPTEGLDVHGVADLRILLHELAEEGATVIVAGHAIDDIHEMSDHLIAVDAGTVIFAGTPDDMDGEPHASVRCTAATAEELDRVAAAFARAGYTALARTRHSIVVDAGGESAAELNRLAFQEGVALRELAVSQTSVEKRFLASTGAGDRGPLRKEASV